MADPERCEIELIPCRFCDAVPEPEIRRPTRHTDYNAIGHECLGPYRVTPETAAAEWNAANAPADPALLALAKLGAMVLDWSPLECGFPAMPGSVIDTMAVKSGCSLEDSGDGGHACWIAPNVRLAIAALLAPDGAASGGVTDGD